jgi:hypothetical protein
MSNPTIYYTDLTNYTWTGELGAWEGYSSGNLNDYNYASYWSASANTAQSLSLDLGSSKTITHMVIANHNFYTSYMPDGHIEISASTTTNFDVTATRTYSGSMDNVITSNDDLVYEFPQSYSARYFKITWIGNLIDSGPYSGEIWFPTKLEFDTPYNFGYKKDNTQYATNETVALDGSIRTNQTYAGRYIWELKFILQSNTFATNFRTFHRNIRGGLRPFFFVDTDGTIRYMHLNDYVPVTGFRYNNNNVESLIMKTQQSNF